MKKAFLFALTTLATLLATSCQKDNLGRILTATIEQYVHNAKANSKGDISKAYINAQNYACWENGDQVSINGTPCTIRFEEGAQGTANAAKIDAAQLPTDQALLAYYPADQATHLSSTGGSVTLPQVQTYRENNGHQIINNPMAAYCPADGSELRFRNLAALLKVTLLAPSSRALSVKAVLVKGDNNQMLWGTAPLTLNNQHQPMLDKMTNGNAEVCLSFGDSPAEITAGSSKSFYIVVPAGSDFFSLSIAVITDENDSYLKVSKPDQTLPRNSIGAFAYTPTDADTVSAIFYEGSIAGFRQNAFGRANVTFNEDGILLFDKDLTTIESFAFENCKNLTSVSLPATLTSIGNSAFYRCESLSSVSLPAALTSIGEYSFYHCDSLRTINWPDRLSSMGKYAFEDCKSLTSIDLSHTAIEWMATHVFNSCTSLTSIILPQNLKTIDKYAFEFSTSLTSIDLPATLKSIGEKAFCGCESLTTVYVNRWGGMDPIITEGGENMFLECHNSLRIYVPNFEDADEWYKQCEYWSNYADIIFRRQP